MEKEIRKIADESTSIMLESMKKYELTRDEMHEWYGYIRGIRDMVYELNCQENGESKANDNLQEAWKILRENFYK